MPWGFIGSSMDGEGFFKGELNHKPPTDPHGAQRGNIAAQLPSGRGTRMLFDALMRSAQMGVDGIIRLVWYSHRIARRSLSYYMLPP